MTALPIRMRRWLAALGVAAGLLAALPGAAADLELPPVDEVFVLSAQATAPDRIELRWKIADGYYLYRHRTAATADAAFADARLALPKGKPYHDEFFGDDETYRQSLTGVLTGTPTAGAATTTLTVKYQGCADAGVCYPPQTRTLKVALAQAGDAGGFGFGPRKVGGLFGLGGDAGKVDAAPLPAEQAFRTEVIADGGNALLVRITPAKGYYVYRDKLSTRLDGMPGLSARLPAASALPRAQPYHDEHFGQVQVYFDQFEFTLPVARTRTDAASGTLVLGLQGCQDGGICYPPMTRRIAVSLPAGTLAAPAAATPDTADAPAATTTAMPASPAAPTQAQAQPGLVADDAVPPAATATEVARTPPPAGVAGQGSPGLWLSLLLALAGGLILNLMPCVLPVLSLKAVGLAGSGESRGRARMHALWYTAGVLGAFAALGALVLALRQAGLALGWGFQLQQPLVVAALALLMLALGLALSGLWFVGIGIGERGAALMQRSGPAGDFATGVLAVVLATPCIGPFMGAALAYAFTGPALGGMLVFLGLGLGLALPFLLIGFVPALARRLPRPGAWMETFKQLMAFPMYLTAAWLVWVLARQRGADAVGLWLLAAIALALALWALMHARQRGSGWARALALVALLAMLWPLRLIAGLERAPPAVAVEAAGIEQPYSAERLAQLRAQGRMVFVNITADWCVTCKANERAVFSQQPFKDAMRDAGAVYMVGDYTDVDPALTRYLEAHRAVGVPLYVLYPSGGGEGRVLPTVVTPSLVLDALAEAAR